MCACISVLFSPILGRKLLPLIAFGIVLGSLTAIVMCLADGFFDQFVPPHGQPQIVPTVLAETFVSALVFAPPIETALFQAFIIELVGLGSRGRKVIAVVISTVIFATMHLFSGGAPQAARMLIFGAILASLYCWARRTSLAAAFSLTLSTHITHNAAILFVIFKFPN